MGVGRIHENGLCLTGELDVSDKLSLSAQEAPILLASNWLSDAKAHVVSSPTSDAKAAHDPNGLMTRISFLAALGHGER
jgi:hypothetical protein